MLDADDDASLLERRAANTRWDHEPDRARSSCAVLDFEDGPSTRNEERHGERLQKFGVRLRLAHLMREAISMQSEAQIRGHLCGG